MVIRVGNAQRIAWAALAVAGLALVAAGMFAGREGMLLRGGSKAQPKKHLPPPPQSTHRLLPFAAYAPVLSNNVFGFDAGALTPLFGGGPRSIPAAAAPLPATINIKVYGTIAEDSGHGYAIIATMAGTQELYKTGDDIPGTGKLLKVYPFRVIVESGGKRHEIPTVSMESPAIEPSASTGTAAPGGFVRRTGAGEFVVDRSGVDESITNPKRLLTDARLLPHHDEKGAQDGFVVSEVKAGGLYGDLGLQNGDVLMGVNGLALKTPESALQAFAALKGMDKLSLDIIRNNTKTTLTYNIR